MVTFSILERLQNTSRINNAEQFCQNVRMRNYIGWLGRSDLQRANAHKYECER